MGVHLGGPWELDRESHPGVELKQRESFHSDQALVLDQGLSDDTLMCQQAKGHCPPLHNQLNLNGKNLLEESMEEELHKASCENQKWSKGKSSLALLPLLYFCYS
jgi:hypothetical protein